MCFGHGDKQYDAYSSGDFSQWKLFNDQQQALEEQYAQGKFKGEPARKKYVANWTKLQQAINPFAAHAQQDPSANMEMREVTRQGDVSLGKIGIDKNFSKFDKNYYNKYKKDYSGFYTPNLNKQFTEAQDKLTSNLADRGILASTVGSGEFADLSRQNADAKGNIANEANDAAAKLRGTVQNAKTNLYNLNQASADPQAVNAQAVGQATALVAPPTYSPLGRVFADFLNGLPTFADARAGSTQRRYASPYTTPSGYGSGSVVK